MVAYSWSRTENSLLGLNFYVALSGRSGRTMNQRTKSHEKKNPDMHVPFLQILVLIWCCSSFCLNALFVPWYVNPTSCLTESGGRTMSQKTCDFFIYQYFVTLNLFSSYELDISHELHNLRIYTAIILRLSSFTRSSSYVDLRQKSIGKSQGFHMQLYSNLSNRTEDV